MKYWTSSRVGAVPQPPGQPPSKKKDNNSRFHRKKGITMEDLKKQTAARLAQEQKHNNRNPRGVGSGSSGAGGALTGDATNHVSNANSSGGRVVDNDFSLSQASLSKKAVVGGRENYHPSPLSVPPESGSGLEQSHSSSSAAGLEQMRPLTATAPFLPYDLHRSPSLEQQSGHVVTVPSTTSPFPLKAVSGSNNISAHSSSSFDSSSQRQQRKKSKLPHGLTVQELKEMTKARLQAEAAEQNGMAPPTPTANGGVVPPLIASTTPTLGFRDDGVSPLPPSFSQRPRPHSQARDAWSYDSRSEAWETGSVSTVASEYLGSESAYGMGSFGPEEPSPSPYGRPPMSGGPLHNFSDAPPMDGVLFPGASSNTTPGYHFDGNPSLAGPLQLRRRAATLSPHQGLSFLDERREVFPDQDNMPTLPSFSSPSSMHYPSRSRNTYGAGDRFNTNCAGSGMRMMGGTNPLELNRPRTSSAASLPPMSHTAEEFLVDPSTFRRIPSGLSPYRDQAPSPTVTGLLADAFQESSSSAPCFGGTQTIAPPPGLGGVELRPRAPPSVSQLVGLGNHPMNSTGLDSYCPRSDEVTGMDLRARASTWGGTTSLDSMFGPGLFGGTVPESQQHLHHQQQQQQESLLCDDLASILKLSVTDQQYSHGDNQLFPPPGL